MADAWKGIETRKAITAKVGVSEWQCLGTKLGGGKLMADWILAYVAVYAVI